MVQCFVTLTLTSKHVARVCQHKLNFLLTVV